MNLREEREIRNVVKNVLNDGLSGDGRPRDALFEAVIAEAIVAAIREYDGQTSRN